MQTVIQLDDALLEQATKLAREQGFDLSHFIEKTLRDRIAPSLPAVSSAPVRLTTVGGDGIRAGIDLDKSSMLLSLMEQGG
jgi:hypothetical protein